MKQKIVRFAQGKTSKNRKYWIEYSDETKVSSNDDEFQKIWFDWISAKGATLTEDEDFHYFNF